MYWARSNEVAIMDGWDFIIIFAAVYVALATLVRLMRTRWELRRAMLWLEHKSKEFSDVQEEEASAASEEAASEETKAA